MPFHSTDVRRVAINDSGEIVVPHLVRNLIAEMKVKASDTNHGPRLRGDKASLGSEFGGHFGPFLAICRCSQDLKVGRVMSPAA